MKQKKPRKTKNELISLNLLFFTFIVVTLITILNHTLDNIYLIVGIGIIGFFVQVIINEFCGEKRK